ncbi:MAG: arylsulfatase A-like enzyme [Candidatus Azotimanducaceae bacterium]|jgi:arylsulfatase A-like enzyme
MQAPEERIAPYREVYSVGLRSATTGSLSATAGILQTDAPLPMHEVDFSGDRPAWDSLTPEQQDAWIEEMATYAAMVEIMDDGIGETIEALKARGMYENTTKRKTPTKTG